MAPFRKERMETVSLWISATIGDCNSRSSVRLQLVEFRERRRTRSLFATEESVFKSVCMFWNPLGGTPWHSILVQLIALGVEDFLLLNWLGMISGRVTLCAQGMKWQVISHSTGSLARNSMIRLASKILCQGDCHLRWFCVSDVNLLLHTACERRWQGLSYIFLASKSLW